MIVLGTMDAGFQACGMPVVASQYSVDIEVCICSRHMRRKSMEEKTYQAPEIIYEGELEVHAGSVTGGGTSPESETLDPLGLGTNDG